MERQGDRAGGHGWPSKPLHPATCCLGTAATGCAPRRTRRRRLLSRTWPGLQGGCIAKTLSTADLRLATPPLQKSMGDFLQARIDHGDIWEAGGRLCCRWRQGMHVSHHVVMRRVTTCALLARTRAALRSLSAKPTAAYQTTAHISRTWPPSAMASDTRSVPRHGCPKRTVRGGHILFLDPHVKAYCQGTPSVWCRVLGRIPAGGQWPYFMRGGPREAFPPHSYIPECWQPT